MQVSPDLESDLRTHIPWREVTNSKIVFELPIPFALGFWRKGRLHITWMQIDESGMINWLPGALGSNN